MRNARARKQGKMLRSREGFITTKNLARLIPITKLPIKKKGYYIYKDKNFSLKLLTIFKNAL